MGLRFRAFHNEIASHGAFIIANGVSYIDEDEVVQEEDDPSLPPASDQAPEDLTAAIDWVYENAGKGEYRHVDRTRIGVWGQSCGGLEAYGAGALDDRVHHLGIFNSGVVPGSPVPVDVSLIKKPVFYIIGGEDELAYPNVSGPTLLRSQRVSIPTSSSANVEYWIRPRWTTPLFPRALLPGRPSTPLATVAGSLAPTAQLVPLLASTCSSGFFEGSPTPRIGSLVREARMMGSTTSCTRTWMRSMSSLSEERARRARLRLGWGAWRYLHRLLFNLSEQMRLMSRRCLGHFAAYSTNNR